MKIAEIAYFNSSRNESWLVFFRITVSAFCILHILSILPDIHNFLSDNAYVLPNIIDAYSLRISPTIYTLSKFLEKYMHITSQLVVVKWFISCYVAALLCLLVGFRTRFAAIIALVLHVILNTSMEFYLYGVDFFCTIALFYCLVFPVGRHYSVDRYIRIKRGKQLKPSDPILTNICLRLLQIHLCIAYFFGGFEKIIGYNWWNGESIWKALHLSYSPTYVKNVNQLAHYPWIFVSLGWLTIITEMLYPVCMNIKFTRKFWLALIIGMHIIIAIILGLFFFSTFMIILSVTAYYLPYSKTSLYPQAETHMQPAGNIPPYASSI
jgi:hypothetical protein